MIGCEGGGGEISKPVSPIHVADGLSLFLLLLQNACGDPQLEECKNSTMLSLSPAPHPFPCLHCSWIPHSTLAILFFSLLHSCELVHVRSAENKQNFCKSALILK